ncbi:MAG: YchF/TatD family DNA exonuclease [Candidatus Sumerlaeota bacterium]|nr:YchF/TatD family DNA exonuclease [Candidatus Sumerlaeota bacterium]
MIIDSHAHLADKKFARDLERALARASDAGVERVIAVADCAVSSRKTVALAHRFDKVYATVGVHPHQARRAAEQDFTAIDALTADPRVVAIGEIGLDYHYDPSEADAQKAVFCAQLQLAREKGLPCVVHCRDAYPDLLEILVEARAEEIGGVAHCFTGTVEDARRLVDMGWYLGIGGPITFPHADRLREAVRATPADRLLLETDSPYLPPQAKRGRRNEPSYLKYVCKAVGDAKGLSYQETARITKMNAVRLFNIAAHVSPEVAYSLKRSLYLNITNECTNQCYFCHRKRDFSYWGYNLRLPTEPTYEEIRERLAGDNLDRYNEVVFCGIGEPTMRLDLLLRVAAEVKRRGLRVRLNTNGQGSLAHGTDIVPQLINHVDAVSISLNAATREEYNRMCRPQNPEKAFDAMLDFAKRVKKAIPEVSFTVVATPDVDIDACRKLAEGKLRIPLRVREYIPPPKSEVDNLD